LGRLGAGRHVWICVLVFHQLQCETFGKKTNDPRDIEEEIKKGFLFFYIFFAEKAKSAGGAGLWLQTTIRDVSKAS
jgi:hypothetical protein